MSKTSAVTRRRIPIAAAWFVAVTTCLLAQGQPVPLSALDLLERYNRGEHDAVVQVFLAAPGVDAIRKELEAKGPAWTIADGPAAEGRRRLVAATMALEFANARLDDEWRTLRSLVEWGCELLRRGPPTEGERRWQIASIAVAGGALDDGLLFKPARWGQRTYGHLAHAESRFPAEPRIVFAARFAVPATARIGSQTFFAGLEPALDDPTPDLPRRTARESTIRRLNAMTGDPVVGAEAALRAGHLLLIDLRLDEALKAFETAARLTRTPYVTYLAHFLSGRTLERQSRLEEAERAYGRALDAVPLAQSAVLSRSALLVRAGRVAEAHSLTAASFAGRPRPPDPWRLFPSGDYYRWPELIAALRAELRR